jgi:hypothetical protein
VIKKKNPLGTTRKTGGAVQVSTNNYIKKESLCQLTATFYPPFYLGLV